MRVLHAIKTVSHLQIMAVLLLVLPVSWAAPTESGNPQQVVNLLHESLIKAMREGDKLGYRGRFELLAPVVDRTHDLDLIARTTLGADWVELSDEQQRTFKDIFRKLSIGTYAGWFKSYDNERFEFLEQQSMPRDQVLVRTQLVQSGGEPIRFDYILHQGKDGWRIVNVLADGVSDLALKRVEYRAVLQRDGFQKLIGMLKEKIALTEQD